MNYFTTPLLCQNTIDLYNTRINKWRDIVPHKSLDYIIMFPDHSLKLLIQHLKRREKIESKTNICTRTNLHAYIIAITAILKYSAQLLSLVSNIPTYHEIWSNLININIKPVQDRRNKQMPTMRQENKGALKVTYNDIITKRDCGELSHYEHLLLSMYTYIYPVRADYFATHIVNDDNVPETPNYIRLKDGSAELVITDFKTSKRYKQIHYPKLPSELYKIIIKSLEEHPRKYLFEFKGQFYSRNRFSNWAAAKLKKLFGEEINLTIIRHLFISTLSMELSADELEKIGNLMGHSIAIQRLYKWHQTEDDESDIDEDDDE
jgi:integrase